MLGRGMTVAPSLAACGLQSAVNKDQPMAGPCWAVFVTGGCSLVAYERAHADQSPVCLFWKLAQPWSLLIMALCHRLLLRAEMLSGTMQVCEGKAG